MGSLTQDLVILYYSQESHQEEQILNIMRFVGTLPQLCRPV